MRQSLPLLLILLSGCAHANPKGQASLYDGAPDWVVDGTGAVKAEGTRWIVGVGQASQKEPHGRALAEVNARREVATLVNTFIAQLSSSWARDCGIEREEPKEVTELRQSLREFEQSRPDATQVVDRWTSLDGSTVFVLARQDVDALLNDFYAYPRTNERMREIIKARAGAVFDDLNSGTKLRNDIQ